MEILDMIQISIAIVGGVGGVFVVVGLIMKWVKHGNRKNGKA